MSTINIEKISIVHWFPALENHKCGYCKNAVGNISYGMWAEQLTVEDYQNLIDRGWRRSGKYCYKPLMDITCCPQYTIRCETLNFHISKSQKKIIKRFNKFLTDGIITKEKSQENVQSMESESSVIVIKQRPNCAIDFTKLNGSDLKIDDAVRQLENKELPKEEREISPGTSQADSEITVVEEEKTEQKISEKTSSFKKGVGADPNKPPCKKAKLMRLEKKQQKQSQSGTSVPKPQDCNQSKTLQQFLEEIPSNARHKLTVKYERMNKNHSTFKISAKLFEKYQMAIHNEPLEECNEKSFREFLVDTPLKSVRVRGTRSGVTYGSFHQQYWLDDKLIAVGVVDILPRSISSVYFFYDPDYRFLTLGTYGSLREVHFVRDLHEQVPDIEYYYMGFYIHSCPKMRYKGKLHPSFLLCPETYQWFPIETCYPKLDINKYSRLTENSHAVDENKCSQVDMDSIKVLIGYSFTVFGNYKRKYGEEDVFSNIAKLVGKKCASNLLFVASNKE